MRGKKKEKIARQMIFSLRVYRCKGVYRGVFHSLANYICHVHSTKDLSKCIYLSLMVSIAVFSKVKFGYFIFNVERLKRFTSFPPQCATLYSN